MAPNIENPLGFSSITLADLDSIDPTVLDGLPYGVVGLSDAGLVEIYNETEARLAGLSRETVIGVDYFFTTAQCMNNFMVAQRFEDEDVLDITIDYVLTLRMRPTPVRLRLLKAGGFALRYILIQRL